MNKIIPVSAGVIFVAAAFFAWRIYEVRHAPPPPYVGFVRDSSGSDAVSCAAVRSLAMGLFDLPGIRRGSKAALITTGDKHNAYEGKLAGVFDIPFTTLVMEGKEATRRRQQQFGDAIQQACEATPQTGQSPIFAAVKSGIEHLRANGCGKTSSCALFVVTDGDENVDGLLRSALNGSKTSLGKIRGIIVNDGIKVNFCGFAQTRVTPVAHRSQRGTSADRLKEVWTALFTAPALVGTAPYCPD